jgi:hypothetical protein
MFAIDNKFITSMPAPVRNLLFRPTGARLIKDGSRFTAAPTGYVMARGIADMIATAVTTLAAVIVASMLGSSLIRSMDLAALAHEFVNDARGAAAYLSTFAFRGAIADIASELTNTLMVIQHDVQQVGGVLLALLGK